MSDIVDYTLGGTAATLAFAPLSLITDCEIQECLIRTVLQRAVFIFLTVFIIIVYRNFRTFAP